MWCGEVRHQIGRNRWCEKAIPRPHGNRRYSRQITRRAGALGGERKTKKTMMMLRYLVVLLCLTWTVSEASLAQKIDQDPRTKEMPEGRSIPAYRSVQEFLSESSSSMLRDAAVPVGRATIRSLPTNGGPTRLLKRSAGKAPSFELPALEVRRADNGTVRWMNGELGRAEASKRGLDRIGEALRVLDDHAAAIGAA